MTFFRLGDHIFSVILVVTGDSLLAQSVQAAAAALGVQPLLVAHADQAKKYWGQANLILIGTDQASSVIGAGLEGKAGTHVIGTNQRDLLAWSVPLAAPALLLPDQSSFLSSLMSGPTVHIGNNCLTVAVLGGSGGVGASTLAAGLAQRAVRADHSVALVELDEYGGGLDLLFGAEREPGWRWPDLSSATGYVGKLSGRLPNTTGVDLVSTSRASPGLPSSDAVKAIVRSLQRTHDLVVLDAGTADRVLEVAMTNCLVVVAGDIKPMLSAKARLAKAKLVDVEVVVRRSPAWSLDPQLVEETLKAPVIGVIDEDRKLGVDAAFGSAPALGARSRFSRVCTKILDRLSA